MLLDLQWREVGRAFRCFSLENGQGKSYYCASGVDLRVFIVMKKPSYRERTCLLSRAYDRFTVVKI